MYGRGPVELLLLLLVIWTEMLNKGWTKLDWIRFDSILLNWTKRMITTDYTSTSTQFIIVIIFVATIWTWYSTGLLLSSSFNRFVVIAIVCSFRVCPLSFVVCCLLLVAQAKLFASLVLSFVLIHFFSLAMLIFFARRLSWRYTVWQREWVYMWILSLAKNARVRDGTMFFGFGVF